MTLEVGKLGGRGVFGEEVLSSLNLLGQGRKLFLGKVGGTFSWNYSGHSSRAITIP